MTRASGRIGRTGRAMLLAATGALLLVGTTRAASDATNVVVLPTTGVVDQVMAGYIADGIAQAESSGAAAVIIELDTPGGDLFSTNDIVGSELDATIPVIVWVAPSGGFAASAGTFITLASNIAVMAPGTSIGAASPVGSGGTDITGTEGQKVTNDAAAKIQSIAETRGRNVDWARSTVLQAASASAEQAVSLKAVDGIAPTLLDVLAFADGRTVTVGTTSVTLHIKGAATTEIDMGPIQVLLHLLNDPNIAFVLFIIGGLGLVGELFHPNFFTGTVGALAIIGAFIGFGSLPLNVAGLILIAAGHRAVRGRGVRAQPRPAGGRGTGVPGARRRHALRRARDPDRAGCQRRAAGAGGGDDRRDAVPARRDHGRGAHPPDARLTRHGRPGPGARHPG